MRVASNSQFNYICSIGLDQSIFGLTTQWMKTIEQLKKREQDLVFLKRCKVNNLTPKFIKNSVTIPPSIQHRKCGRQLQKDTSGRIMNIVIRDHHHSISLLKTKADKYSTVLKNHTAFDKIRTAVNQAGCEMKKDTKVRQKRKFENLRSKLTRSRKSSDNDNDDVSPESRITILNNINVSDEAVALLAKGPSFAITPMITKQKLERVMETEVTVLAYGVRWKAAAERFGTGIGGTYNDIKKACPFKSRRKAPPNDDSQAEKAIRKFVGAMNTITKTALKEVRHISQNTTKEQLNAIKQLKSDNEILITKSDKGGEMVVMRENDMLALVNQHLTDRSTYEPLRTDPTDALRLKINKTLDEILRKHEIPETVTRKLMTPPSAKTQRFYALPKTHKTTLKIRPIVSGVGGIFERLSWLLNYILQPLLRYVKAHIDSTRSLIDRFQNLDPATLKGKIPVSFDVVSLYTNIDIREAIDTSLQYLVPVSEIGRYVQ